MRATEHWPVVVIGGGQAGLAMSHELKERAVSHVIFEKNRIAHSWRTQRWDAFCLVTPNWQCRLPGHHYPGKEPHGFMPKDEIVSYIEDYAKKIDAPVREGVAVKKLSRNGSGYRVETQEGTVTADQVVLAVSAYHKPKIPALANDLSASIKQIHSSEYRNPGQLPEGAVMVVGSGQSGCQIAEDLHLAGRKVHLVVGSAPRCPRVYRGRDAVDWLDDLGQYDLPVDKHPLKDGVRGKANHYLTGRDGGRDIDLRRFALEGMILHGRLLGLEDGRLVFGDDLTKNLDAADAVYNGICTMIDKHIESQGIEAPGQAHYRPVWQPEIGAESFDSVQAGITSIVWATGFTSDWSWVDLPVFENNYPKHERGITPEPGLYVVGLPWLYTWGSGRFVGVGRDAAYIADHVADVSREKTAVPVASRKETRPWHGLDGYNLASAVA
ncbi:MSMEG_0569 family flavin-dependent oxidoreductase [Flaviflagellibacter deserti]|uniref:MSMEG_0569 family flavin-dependent oxidoreductase n=1 Tax=Flaviflagellibacter deserti TaxID=2267266 RepID=A0ABV9Z0R9_9HYPH